MRLDSLRICYGHHDAPCCCRNFYCRLYGLCAFLLSVCEAGPVVRVRIRRIVIRIDDDDAAIRIRVIVRAKNDTSTPSTVSTCFLRFKCWCAPAPYLKNGGGRAGADAPCTPTAYDISMVPLKARRDPKFAFEADATSYAKTKTTPPIVFAVLYERRTTRAPVFCQ